MVELTLGRNIKTATDKLLAADKAQKIIELLDSKEKILESAIKKQTPTDKIKLYDFSCSTGNEKEEYVKTFALMRQPHNAWLWAYMFDNCDTPIVNFCGFDDLDGFSKFVTILKESVDKHGSL